MKKIFLGLFILLSIFCFSATPSKTKRGESMELIFIMDRSGSMGGLETDTIGGYNSMLNKQKKEEKGEIYVTTVLFDDQYELLHNRIPISKVKPITESEYYVRGNTALLDAIGKTISQVKANQSRFDKKEKAKKVLFIIITDGMENSSREYSAAAVKNMIETQKRNAVRAEENTTGSWNHIYIRNSRSGRGIDHVRQDCSDEQRRSLSVGKSTGNI